MSSDVWHGCDRHIRRGHRKTLEAQPAPLLEVWESSGTADITRSSKIFRRQIPQRLHKLDAFACDFFSDVALFSAPLTYLCFVECSPDVLEILRRVPTLQQLTLIDAASDIDLNLQLQDIKLPNLRHLKVAEATLILVELMPHLHFPPNTELELRCGSEPKEEHEEHILSTLTQIYSAQVSVALATGHSFQSLQIVLDDHDIALILYNPMSPGGTSSVILPPNMHLSFFWGHEHGNPKTLIPRILTVMPAVEKVRVVDMKGAYLSYVLKNVDLGSACRINLRGLAAHGFVKAINAGVSSSLLPSLETISLKHFKFAEPVDEKIAVRVIMDIPMASLTHKDVAADEGVDWKSPLPEGPFGLPFFAAVQQAMKRRASSGHPARLVITNCSLTMDMLQSLRDYLGPALEWDGQLDGVDSYFSLRY
ncbi:hypothetical protein BV25DRAFT_1918905 [Artomyces pyxidatus]|uniref:Uncharacterized protein n=1 Tax=Artomyces pyxidatus TaxID=48021 RepID=A0ACB8ST76_9AGAM|nr:hypothetical protein BV25DRAFT_1918905 [Artomyces pyxidatus]